ncbi:hypothetical protein HPG69_016028 [Diceros bicornis minor]|uniref:Uncharacterized protein n=1 Tax=Diceros bicornis minor TaxID=77932 RepID=A0A7J7FD48_DICBM|nr:hypothetical protein HPG69_016028 [Diceros bicornis minor]
MEQLLQMSLQKDPTMGQAQPSMLQMLRFPAVRHLFICLIPLWFASNFSIYGLAMSLQSFEINIYMIQVLFAIADFSFCFLGFLAIKSLRRRPTQMAFFLLSGILPSGPCHDTPGPVIPPHHDGHARKRLHGWLHKLLSVYTGELYPTVMWQRGQSTTMILANIGSTLSPLVGMTAELHSSLPFLIYGAVPVAACPTIVLLPETMGQPLPYTEQDLERRWKEKLGQRQEEQQMVLLQAS